jgi:segregation and condensation protein A
MAEVHLPVFEGPLDLLLHLIERDDLDITAVSLVQVTDQYLRAVHQSDGIDAHALAEFVAIGAKLIFLKSRALLPPQPVEEEPEFEEGDVGQELVDLLREYKRFGEVTDVLEERQEHGLRVYPRVAPPPELPPGTGLDAVTLDRLTKIMREVMRRKKPSKRAAVVRRETVTVTQRIQELRGRLHARKAFSFRQVMEECESRVEVIVAFLAILELLKNGECDVRQPQTWGDFDVVALEPAAAAAN